MKTTWRNSVEESTQLRRDDPSMGGRYGESLSDISGQQIRLRDSVRKLRRWLYEVEQLGVPKFGETGYRLRYFRSSLSEHFDCCKRQKGRGSVTGLESECRRLLKRLDDLIDRLEMPDPPFQSWQELIRSLNDFGGDLECLEMRLVD